MEIIMEHICINNEYIKLPIRFGKEGSEIMVDKCNVSFDHPTDGKNVEFFLSFTCSVEDSKEIIGAVYRAKDCNNKKKKREYIKSAIDQLSKYLNEEE
jgi:hypothetical protein